MKEGQPLKGGCLRQIRISRRSQPGEDVAERCPRQKEQQVQKSWGSNKIAVQGRHSMGVTGVETMQGKWWQEGPAPAGALKSQERPRMADFIPSVVVCWFFFKLMEGFKQKHAMI